MKKKLLLTFMVIVLSLIAFGTISVSAATSGTCGANLTWTLDNSGTLTISGTGAMENYPDTRRIPWDASSIKNIVIGDKVTSIGEYAFFGCHYLKNVTIPGNVTSIGPCAFRCCSRLENVTICEGVTIIGDSAFSLCELTGISFPDSVTTIGKNAFNQNPIKCVTIGKGVTSIGEDAFYGCSALKTIIIPDNVKSIGDHAFDDCDNLKNVLYTGTKEQWNAIGVPRWAISGGGGLEYYYNAIGIKEQGSITYVIGKDYVALSEADTNIIGEVVIPSTIDNMTVSKISSQAFRDCDSLTSITIPNSVRSIGGMAFYDCNGLTTANISNGVTSIDWQAFQNCDSLTSITIPNSVTYIGGYAFSSCSNLKSVYITDISAWCNISFAGSDSNPLSYATNLYLNNKLITDLVIADGVTEIKNRVFYNFKGLTSVTIGDSVTSIGDEVFSYCNNLISVTIGDSVTSIGGEVFSSCNSLASINVSENNDKYASDDGVLFDKNKITLIMCPGGKTGEYTIPDSAQSIGDYAFYSCNGLTNVVITDNIISIGKRAFAFCDGLTSATIGDSVQSIGEYAFYCCDNITSVTIPNSVTSIGSNAFSYCSSLTTVNYNGNETDWNKISIGSSGNSYLTNAARKFFCYVIIIDEDGNEISKKTYDINSLADISDIEKNEYATHLYTDIERKNEFDLTTQINKNTTLYVNYIKLDLLKLEGTTSVDIGVKAITQKVSFETDKEAIYFACTISYPDDLVLNEIKSDSFEIEYDNQTIEGNTYLYLTCIYNGNGNIPTYQEVSPFELEFSITENVQTGDVFTVEISESALIDNRGNVYQLENAECSEIKINSIKVTKITITGAEEIDCPTVYTAFASPGNATDKTILWSVDNEEVATVSQDGFLTPVKSGTVVLKASAIDGSEVYATKTISIVPGLAKVSDMTSNIGVWDKQYSNAENTYTIYVPKSATSIKLTAKHSGILTSTSNQTFINNFPKTITLTSNETVLTLNYTCPDFEDNTYTITIKKFEGTKTEVSEDNKSFTITPINIENGKTVILALYNGEKFVEMQKAVYTGEAVPFTTTKSYTKAKVMVWDDITNLKPVCEVENIQ